MTQPLPKSGTFFIAGTDTDAGKTTLACGWLKQHASASCYGLKPVAAGATETADGLRNDDALRLMAASGIKLSYQQVNPVLLLEPASPHLAAQQEKRRLSVDRLLGYVRGTLMARRADLVLVEGAGGWLVPLNERETLADFARELNVPVVLVVGMKLGCLNHALLTVEAIERSGVTLAGWVANPLAQPMPWLEENIKTLEQRIDAPRFAMPVV